MSLPAVRERFISLVKREFGGDLTTPELQIGLSERTLRDWASGGRIPEEDFRKITAWLLPREGRGNRSVGNGRDDARTAQETLPGTEPDRREGVGRNEATLQRIQALEGEVRELRQDLVRMDSEFAARVQRTVIAVLERSR